MRLEWRSAGVPHLATADLAAVGAVLDRHARISRVERLERSQAWLAARPWASVLLEIDGRVAGAPCRDGAWTVGNVSEVGLRTYGRAAAFVARPAGLLLVVDDEPWLARETVAAVRRILRPRERPALAFLASAWGVPSLVLGLPVAASAADPAGHGGTLTWAGMLLAGVLLAWWLWWYHRVWLARPFVALTPGVRPTCCLGAPHPIPRRRSHPRAPVGASSSTRSPHADAARLDRGDLSA